MTHEPTRQTPPLIPIVPLAARSLSCPISANSPSFPTRSVATSLAHLDCRKPLTLIVAGPLATPAELFPDDAHRRRPATDRDLGTRHPVEFFQLNYLTESRAACCARGKARHVRRLIGTGELAVRASRRLRSEELLVTSYGSTRLRMDLDRMSLWQDHMGIRQLAEHYSRLTSTCFSIRHTATTTATPVPTGAHVSGMFVHFVNLRRPATTPAALPCPAARARPSLPASGPRAPACGGGARRSVPRSSPSSPACRP